MSRLVDVLKQHITPGLAESAQREFGQDALFEIAKEELAELIVAISHWQRRRVDLQILSSEVADVLIVLEQLCVALPAALLIEELRVKQRRLRDHVDARRVNRFVEASEVQRERT